MELSGLNEELYGKEITITERVVFIEEEEFTMNDWISIKDRLPDPYEYVLVAAVKESSEPTCISIARQFESVWEMMSNEPQSNACASGDLTWFMENNEITHWMPLPKPPINTI